MFSDVNSSSYHCSMTGDPNLALEGLPSRQSIPDTLYLETLLGRNIMEKIRENEASFSFCKLCIHSFIHAFIQFFVSIPTFFQEQRTMGSSLQDINNLGREAQGCATLLSTTMEHQHRSG